MPITVMALLGAQASRPSDGELSDLSADVGRVGTPAESSAVFALDTHALRIAIDQHGPTVITTRDQLRPPPAPMMATWTLDADDSAPERTAQALLDQVEKHLPSLSCAALETRVHLDLVGAVAPPAAYAFIMNKRQQRHTRDEFFWYYRTNHTSLAKALKPRFVRYATHRVLHSRGELFEDGVTVQEFPHLADFWEHIKVRTESGDEAFDDIRNFVGVVDYWVGDRRFDA